MHGWFVCPTVSMVTNIHATGLEKTLFSPYLARTDVPAGPVDVAWESPATPLPPGRSHLRHRLHLCHPHLRLQTSLE